MTMSEGDDPWQVISVSDSEQPPAVPQLHFREHLLVMLGAILASGLSLIAGNLLTQGIPSGLIPEVIRQFSFVLWPIAWLFPLIVFVWTYHAGVSSVRSEKAGRPPGQGEW